MARAVHMLSTMTNPTYNTKNITFRTYDLYADAIERAAEKAGKSISDYSRDILVQWAYSDLGERMPQLPQITRGRYSSIISQVAKDQGQSVEAFMKQAAQEVAASYLARKSEPPVSGAAHKPSGEYSIAPRLRAGRAR